MSVSTTETVWETKLPLPLVGRGKVRDIYAVGADKLLIVVTDRLSAFDVVLPNPIPSKGRVLNQISRFWFEYFSGTIHHHMITTSVGQMGLDKKIVEAFGPQIDGRSMLVRKTVPLTVECVVRGYLAGSGWKDYQKTGTVCGHKLPAGMQQCEKFPEPIFTPATKESSGHDINIDFNEMCKRMDRKIAEKARELTIDIYQRGAEYAKSKGIIIADTKFEFGILNGELMLIDEVLTPDSSRFWPADRYEAGRDQPSFDKQIVRNHLLEIKWNQKPPAPELPQDVIEKTSAAYQQVYERLTGKKLN